jgi:hypothetical protein
MEWFINLAFGHFFGDYLFQTSKMALNKKKDWRMLLLHCVVYTVVVSVFMAFSSITLTPIHMCMVFVSHIMLDGTDWVERYLDFIGTRSWDHVLKTTGKYGSQEASVNDAITTAFGAIVYVVSDNTLHLFMMWLIFLLV